MAGVKDCVTFFNNIKSKLNYKRWWFISGSMEAVFIGYWPQIKSTRSFIQESLYTVGRGFNFGRSHCLTHARTGSLNFPKTALELGKGKLFLFRISLFATTTPVIFRNFPSELVWDHFLKGLSVCDKSFPVNQLAKIRKRKRLFIRTDFYLSISIASKYSLENSIEFMEVRIWYDEGGAGGRLCKGLNTVCHNAVPLFCLGAPSHLDQHAAWAILPVYYYYISDHY